VKKKSPARAHKSAKEKKRLAKSATKIVGNGFVRRVAKPKVDGDKKRSRLVRIDARFADWLDRQAKVHGSITNVTRRLHAKHETLATMIEIQPGEVEV
jgi:hypothetical protein